MFNKKPKDNLIGYGGKSIFEPRASEDSSEIRGRIAPRDPEALGTVAINSLQEKQQSHTDTINGNGSSNGNGSAELHDAHTDFIPNDPTEASNQ